MKNKNKIKAKSKGELLFALTEYCSLFKIREVLLEDSFFNKSLGNLDGIGSRSFAEVIRYHP